MNVRWDIGRLSFRESHAVSVSQTGGTFLAVSMGRDRPDSNFRARAIAAGRLSLKRTLTALAQTDACRRL